MIKNKLLIVNAGVYNDAATILNHHLSKANDCIADDSNSKRHLLLFVPVATNSAIACELYFKSMIDNYPYTHDLEKLFNMLPNDIQIDIINLTLSGLNNSKYTESDIRRMLNENNKAFVEWRYFLDGGSKKLDSNFLFCLMNSTFKVVCNLKKNSK